MSDFASGLEKVLYKVVKALGSSSPLARSAQVIAGRVGKTLLNKYMTYKGYDNTFNNDIVPSSKSMLDDAMQQSVAPSSDKLGSAYVGALNSFLGAYATSALKAEQISVEDHLRGQKELMDYAFLKNQSSADKQMAFQERMLDKQIAYDTEMSNTAYQRVVTDLKKAGLNPMLAVSQGSASSPTLSVPSGASASISANSVSKADYSKAKEVDIADITGSLLSSAGKLISMLF